ncbi:hypothetical protein OH77DRAFT_1423458 [Trametes cingulata]|nr:hypothetical protein OH77DRAFT_1423458 [Trametes cingulata]
MTEGVPDEVLDVILHHTLAIPAETFESWRIPSTFAGSPRSNASEAILVSKRWQDLGDPWLHESAILRTGKQVAGFARALSKTNARGIKRGRYLRRLRVEGGYGNPFNQILGAAPGIISLFMGFDISLNDSSAGLKRALQKINPSWVIMDSIPGMHSNTQNAQSLHAAVGNALRSWTNLKRIDTSPEFWLREPFLSAFAHVPALEYVSMYTRTVNYQAVEHLTLNPSVKVIQIRDGVRWLYEQRSKAKYPRNKLYLGEGANMTACIDFPLQDVIESRPTALPDLPDKLWSRILGYATHVHGYDYLEMDAELVKFSSTEKVNRTRRSILLVNKEFYRLGLRYLYAAPHFASTQAVAGFIKQIESSEGLASLVRVLYVEDALLVPSKTRISVPLVNLVRVNVRLQAILGLAGGLQSGHTVPLQWAVQVLEPSTLLTPRPFLHFPHLRYLVLHGGCGEQAEIAYIEALPQLVSLGLYDFGPALFSVFRAMSLPRLRELGFSLDRAAGVMEFLRRHGAKLDTLSLDRISADSHEHPVLDLCPNLLRLSLDSTDMVSPRMACGPSIFSRWIMSQPSRIPFVGSSASHRALRHLVFKSLSVRHPDVRGHGQRWNTLFNFLAKHRHKMPALEECRIMTDFPWPMHEMSYMYASYATPMALDLHELGIALSDKDGTRWTRFDPTPAFANDVILSLKGAARPELDGSLTPMRL